MIMVRPTNVSFRCRLDLNHKEGHTIKLLRLGSVPGGRLLIPRMHYHESVEKGLT